MDVAVPLDPSRDGFAFGNFAASDTEAVFDANDLRSMFGAGVDVCLYGDAESCEPTAEAAAFARMVNLARSGGHCEGLVVRVAELFSQAPPVATSSLDNSGEVTHGIIRRFATQLFGDVRAAAATWSRRSLGEIVVELEGTLSRGVLGHTMGLYTQSGGHSVLPYSLSWTSPTTVRVGVYDPNWPGRARHVDIDVATDRWRFSFAASDAAADTTPWTGGAGTLDLVPLAAREAQRCPFCGDGADAGTTGAVMLMRSAGGDWSVRTRSGVLTAGAATEVAGSVRPVRAEGGAVRDHLVDVPASAVSGPEGRLVMEIASPTRAVMLLPTGIVEVQVTHATAPVTVTVTESAVTTSGGDAEVSVSRGILGAVVSGSDIAVTHGADRIVAAHTADGARLRVEVGPTTKTNDDRLAELSTDLPGVLTRPTDFPPLAPAPVMVPPQVPESPLGPESRASEPAEPPVTRISFDVTGWGRSDEDPASYGFVASDVVGGLDDETQVCRSVSCLRRKTVWLTRGGYDPGSGSIVVSPYEFRMTEVGVPFEVRCGRRGPWQRSVVEGSGHGASCQINNVTVETTVYVRAA